MRYRIHFFGNFRVVAPDGTDLTPNSVLHRAFLALVAESGDMRRTRRWIEGRLWSERLDKQAHGSCREALSKISKGFGAHSGILQRNRNDVWFDSALVETDLRPDCGFREPGRQFLEGIDVRDPEFEDWLTQSRSKYDQEEEAEPLAAHVPAPKMSGILVNSRVGEVNTRAEGMAARMVADFVATNFEDWFGAWVRHNSPGSMTDGSADLDVVCDLGQDGGVCVVYISIIHRPTGRVLYSGYRSFKGSPIQALDEEAIGGLVHAAAAKVASKVPVVIGVDRPESIAAGLAHFSKQRLLTFDPENMDEAFGLMSQAAQAHKHSVFIAWQAFIRMAQLVDTVCEDREAKREELDALIAQALELSLDNSLAVALVAIARNMGQDEIAGSAALAKHALKINPKNLFARQAMALVYSASGDIRAAYELSSSCQTLLPDDDTRHLWDLYHSLVCTAFGRLEEALKSAERASVRCSEFAAPRRQLLAIYMKEGRIDDAQHQFERLKAHEKGFSLDRFLNDPEYPVDTLRRRGLIDPKLSGLFE